MDIFWLLAAPLVGTLWLLGLLVAAVGTVAAVGMSLCLYGSLLYGVWVDARAHWSGGVLSLARLAVPCGAVVLLFRGHDALFWLAMAWTLLACALGWWCSTRDQAPGVPARAR